jgi:hypothetical protein
VTFFTLEELLIRLGLYTVWTANCIKLRVWNVAPQANPAMFIPHPSPLTLHPPNGQMTPINEKMLEKE